MVEEQSLSEADLAWNCSSVVSGKLHWSSVSPLGWTVGVEVKEPILRGGSVSKAIWPDGVMLGDSDDDGSAPVSDKHSCSSPGRLGDRTDLVPGVTWCQEMVDYGGGPNLLWITLSGLCITLGSYNSCRYS